MARALFAGIIATAIVSALVYVNAVAGAVAGFDLLADIRAFNGRIGLPVSPAALWVTHAVVGVVVYGSAFALLEPILPGRGVGAGVSFGFITWLAMVVSFMPLAGREPFTREDGAAMIAASLVIHLLYGGILGGAYAALSGGRERRRPREAPRGARPQRGAEQ
jgi:hypothetical protein